MRLLLSKSVPIAAGITVRCKFSPVRADDLKVEMLPWIGKEGDFEALWIIDDDGDYAGQWAMRLPRSWEISSAIWVPESDLTIVASVVSAKPKEA